MIRGLAAVLFGSCLSLLIGCGARTSTLEEEGADGGQNQGGTSGSNGGSNPGGAGSAGAPIAGAGGVGGSFGGGASGSGGSVAGSGGFGASGGSIAGGGGTAGFSGSFGGSFGGSAGFGGFAGFGGDAGAGGTGGVGELCGVLGGTSCDQCVCQSCAPSILSCFSDPGCAFIFACAQQTGCQGISCYSTGTCKSVIDQFGGITGPSMGKVFKLASCSVTSQSACNCN